MPTRRQAIAGLAATALMPVPAEAARKLKIWTFGCPHIGTDERHGIKTATQAIRDAEAIGFDFSVFLGDASGLGLPTHSEGVSWRNQVRNGLVSHRAEDIYPLCGNHDRTSAAGVRSLDWFRRYIDPMGEFPTTSGIDSTKRQHQIVGAAERYKVEPTGTNLTLLFISDVARPLTPGRSQHDGDPGGVVRRATYQWWKIECANAARKGRIVVTFAHYLPKDTTTATGDYEGGDTSGGFYEPLYHGPGSTEGRCSSYLAFVDEDEGRPFIEYLEKHPGQCAVWVAAHNHVKPGKEVGGKAHIAQRFGCTFIQNGALTRFHHSAAKERYPRSRFLEFTEGAKTLRVRSFFHEATDMGPRGLGNIRTVNLPRAVNL